LSAEDLNDTSIQIIDPKLDLTAATGLGSAIGRSFNFLGGQIAGEILGTPGIIAKDTAAASAALNALAQFTERYFLDKKTLAKEFENLQQELVRPSAARTDAGALEALNSTRNILLAEQQQVADVIQRPTNYTNASVSKARQLDRYLRQLLDNYDIAITSYQQGLGLSPGGTGSTANPADFHRQ